MERHASRHCRGAAARVRLERLEDRALPAVAAFGVNLFRDAAGAPGEPIADGTLEVGESFFVEITAQEFDPRFAGLRGVALDIAWNPAALEQLDNPFEPGAVITPLLPVFQTGTLDAAAGTIDNLAGAALLATDAGQAIGEAGPERFALLHFRALAPIVDSPISLAEGKSNIVSVPTATFVAEQFDFARPLVTVVEPAAVATEPAVAFYQGEADAPAVVVTPDALHTDQSFYVEIVAADGGSTSGALHTAAESVIASLALDPSGGELLISTIEIQSTAGRLELPLATASMQETALLPAGTTRVGLTYLPHKAADEVFGAADGDESVPEASALDDTLMQALASALAFAQSQETEDPFQVHFH
jgi:hypothetical protein